VGLPKSNGSDLETHFGCISLAVAPDSRRSVEITIDLKQRKQRQLWPRELSFDIRAGLPLSQATELYATGELAPAISSHSNQRRGLMFTRRN
jgi:hypothetical protein